MSTNNMIKLNGLAIMKKSPASVPVLPDLNIACRLPAQRPTTKPVRVS